MNADRVSNCGGGVFFEWVENSEQEVIHELVPCLG